MSDGVMPGRIEYRGVSIEIDVDGGSGYGYADLFAGHEFRGRLAIAGTRREPQAIRERLRLLAKSKVDVWSLGAGAGS
jgi:hypothetical protein